MGTGESHAFGYWDNRIKRRRAERRKQEAIDQAARDLSREIATMNSEMDEARRNLPKRKPYQS